MSKKKGGIKNLLKGNFLTYAMVIAFYAVFQILVMQGSLPSLYKGLLVPLCIYSIMAVSLNLTVGIMGELSLGHAGFMCVAAFSGAFVSKLLRDSISNDILLFLIALAVIH